MFWCFIFFCETDFFRCSACAFDMCLLNYLLTYLLSFKFTSPTNQMQIKKLSTTTRSKECYSLKNKPHIVPYVHHQASQPILAHHSLLLSYQHALKAKLYQQAPITHSFLNFCATRMHNSGNLSLSVVI